MRNCFQVERSYVTKLTAIFDTTVNPNLLLADVAQNMITAHQSVSYEINYLI